MASALSKQEILRNPGEHRECQVSTLEPSMVTRKDEEILYLQTEIASKTKAVEDLE